MGYVATFAAGSNETVSTAQNAIQQQLITNNTGNFLGPYALKGTVTYQGSFMFFCASAGLLACPL